VHDDDALRVKPAYFVFFFTAGDDPHIAYRIHVPLEPGAKPSIEEFKPPKSASDGQRLLIHARQTAIRALPEVVQPINPVVMPGRAVGEDGVLVYLLAGTKRAGVAVFGKHYRVLVSPDGGTVKRFEPLSKAILEVPLAPSELPPGAEPAGLMVSHLVTDYPLETHVFASLLHKMPVFVATSRGNWRVNGDHISFLGAR
jgi:hypothetical protein